MKTCKEVLLILLFCSTAFGQKTVCTDDYHIPGSLAPRTTTCITDTQSNTPILQALDDLYKSPAYNLSSNVRIQNDQAILKLNQAQITPQAVVSPDLAAVLESYKKAIEDLRKEVANLRYNLSELEVHIGTAK